MLLNPERLEREDRKRLANVRDGMDVPLNQPTDRIDVVDVELHEKVVLTGDAVGLRKAFDVGNLIRDLGAVAGVCFHHHEHCSHGQSLPERVP